MDAEDKAAPADDASSERTPLRPTAPPTALPTSRAPPQRPASEPTLASATAVQEQKPKYNFEVASTLSSSGSTLSSDGVATRLEPLPSAKESSGVDGAIAAMSALELTVSSESMETDLSSYQMDGVGSLIVS